MKENIINLLKNFNVEYEGIRKILKIDREELDKLLEELTNEGIIILTKNKKYMLTEKTDLRKGTIKIKNGYGLFNYDDNILTILPSNLNGAKDLDTVLVSSDGVVSRILKKNIVNKSYEVLIINDKKYIIDNNKMYNLICDSNDIDITSGYIILGEIIDEDNCLLKEKIGQKDKIDMDVLPFAYEYECNYKFSDESIREIEALPSYLTCEDIDRLVNEEEFLDLRSEVCVTIDDITTNDIDDGLILKEDDNFYYLTTVIAMPAYFIKKGSSYYKDVMNNGISCYPAGMAIHMNHPKLSKELCSLNEGSDRLAMCYTFMYDKNNFKCKKVSISKGIINSNKKMTYQDVNEILENNNIPFGYDAYVNLLNKLNSLSKNLERNMVRNGFIKFYNPELKIKCIDNDIILDKRVNHSGENLIENLMLATNKDLTEYLNRIGLNLIYRIDDKPSDIRLFNAINFLSTKLPIKAKEHYSKEDIISAINKIESLDSKKVYNSLLIRCMSRARYSTNNIGHYPIGFNIYAQHTSPIRRCDIINQMIILDYLKYGKEYANYLWEEDLNDLVEHFNKRELMAEKLEQRVEKRKVAKYLSNHIGEVKQGIISSVTNYGFYVEIDEMYEGLVGKRSINGKTKYIENLFTLYDKTNDISYTLGDEVTVMIKGITENDEIDFELCNTLDYKKKNNKVKKLTIN